MAKKAIKATANLVVKAGQATQGPPIATSLGPHGVNTKAFVDDFNQKSVALPGIAHGTPLPVVITIFEDRSIDYKIKSPPASYLLMQAVKAKKGSGEPNKSKIGTVTRADLEKIAQAKWEDLSAVSMDAAVKTIAGTARSMGIDYDASK